MSTNPRSLVKRPSRTVPVTILGLLLVALGGLGAWVLGSLIVTGAWPPQVVGVVDTIGATRLDSTDAVVVAGVLAVLGVIALLAAIVPGRPARGLVLAGDVPGETAISHRDLARHIRLATEQVDGVHSTRVTVTGRRADVTVRTVVDDVEPVLAATRSAADQAVAQLRPTTAPRLRVQALRTS